ncbi:hypothetical protein K7X08_038092 [Anisodus acutangulus]|uniref:non-specific serine/threonine protein kinase n=1 Tax=Anisodus acutangulus TaxID=402998 RepID=A0A9Q1MY93_9SOLA|nr:hypothetical protein K7X08_038092 [Anisodus acutangulus]
MVVFASLSALKYLAFPLIIIPSVTPLSFNFDTFRHNDPNVTYERDAHSENGAIQLITNQADRGLNASIGRATYSKPLHLWDKASGNVTYFSTNFSFRINSQGKKGYGFGLSFFLAPSGSRIPENVIIVSSLGLTSDKNTSTNPFVAVEFDTYENSYDPQGDHVGIDINYMQSVVRGTWFSGIPDGRSTDVWITYNSTSKNVSVVFTGFQLQGNTTVTVLKSVFHNLDLREYLPQWVTFGFTVSVLVLFGFWKMRNVREDEDDVIDGSMTNEFERGAGPKKFLYSELARCTNNFSHEEILGRGGFGGVYKGYIREMNSYIAGKRVSRESKQVVKEYTSEVRIISQDIKSTNIMLDSSFNVKLGDFGLARLVDHEKGSQTTVLAGTMGYMAPECVTTDKDSKETDVYSFGIVALEKICERKAIDTKAEENQLHIVDWVWRLYGMGNLRETVDPKLSYFNEQEMEHLLIVGLWCAHPNNNCRPSIWQAIHVLNFEAPLPTLPPNMPVATYCSPSHEYLPTISFSSPYETNSTEIALTQI